MDNTTPQLGKIIEDGNTLRDAIHIAVAPVKAAQQLTPGEHVGLVGINTVAPCDKNIGIVDPFLTRIVEPDERFYLFLYPTTITSLRHVWVHPDFQTQSLTARKEILK